MPDSLDVTPGWLRGGKHNNPPGLISGVTRKRSSIEKSLTGISRLLKNSVFSEELARREGLLQRCDPRLKTVSLLGCLIAASFIREIPVLAALYAFTIVLAAASNISIRFFVKRVWLFIPLFAGVIALPSIFNVVKPGEPLLTIWDFGREIHLGPWSLGESLAVTRQGVLGAVTLVMRVAVSVSLAVLLTLTTRWSDLLKALRALMVPKVFVLILSMTYRYIFLLLGTSADMFTARQSRLVGQAGPREDRRFIAAGMGTLIGKSKTLSDEVYDAMISRGFTGEPKTLSSFAIKRPDLMTGLVLWLAAALAIGGDYLIGRY